MSFICHIHNYTEYNDKWNVFFAFNPSKCTHTWSSGQPTVQRPGSSRGLPAGAGIRTHNLGFQVHRSIHWATTAQILRSLSFPQYSHIFVAHCTYLHACADTASINRPELHQNCSQWKRLSLRDQCNDSCYNVPRLCNAVWSRRFEAGCVVECSGTDISHTYKCPHIEHVKRFLEIFCP